MAALSEFRQSKETISRTAKDALTRDQMKAVLLSAAIPMIGFGFVDNLVMITAGSAIDSTLGVQFGMATLTAAAFGQVVSDVSGVAFGNTLERVMSPFVKSASLTSVQRKLPIVARLRLAGAVGGVMLGCLLGATSLWLVPDTEKEKVAQQQMQQLQAILQDMLMEEDGVLRDASCTMHLNDGASSSLQLLSGDESNVAVSSLVDANDLAGQCADLKEPLLHDDTLYVPILSAEGSNEVMAVLEVQTRSGVADEEEQAARRLAKYIGIFMAHMSQETD